MLLFGHACAEIFLESYQVRQSLINLHQQIRTGARNVLVT